MPSARCKLLAMPKALSAYGISELQRHLCALLGHDRIVTRAYGRHLLIKRLDREPFARYGKDRGRNPTFL
jgi:hypothetical protein